MQNSIQFQISNKSIVIGKYANTISFLHGKNSFAEVFKNLARYKSENNFGSSK